MALARSLADTNLPHAEELDLPSPRKRTLPGFISCEWKEKRDRAIQSNGKWQIWHFRVNNPGQDELDYWKNLTFECRELIIGNYEQGQFRNVEHVHMHIHLKRQKTIGQMKTMLFPHGTTRLNNIDYYLAPSRHYFDSSCSPELNKDYCTKNGIMFHHREGETRCTMPGEYYADEIEEVEEVLDPDSPTFEEDCVRVGKKARIAFARKLLRCAADESMLNMYAMLCRDHGRRVANALLPDQRYSANGPRVQKEHPDFTIRTDFPSAEEQEVWWISGPAGAGKSAFLRMLFPGAYTKNKDTAYWESYNYNDHSVNNPHMAVVFNELDSPQDMLNFSPNKASFDAIKNLFDIYEFPIEIKHCAQQMIRPRRIAITSNTTVNHIMACIQTLSRHDVPNNKFFGLDVRTLSQAITRRLVQIHINDLLDLYDCFCFRKLKDLNFGGVFHKSLRGEMSEKLQTLISDTSLKGLDLITKVSDLKKEMEVRTMELLAPLRWMPTWAIRASKKPLDREGLLEQIQCALNF